MLKSSSITHFPQTRYAIQQGVIKPLVEMLQYQDAKLIQLVLDGVSNILKVSHGLCCAVMCINDRICLLYGWYRIIG